MLSLTKGGITMATIKSYTNLQQSKKLAEILPLESADMSWVSNGLGKPFARTIPIKGDPEELYACWSFTALLNALPNGIVMNKDSQNGRYHFSSKYIGTYVTADNPVDACYKLILKLNELNLL